MKVPILCSIEQIKEGLQYQGYLTIGENSLNFQLKLAGPISGLCGRKPAQIELDRLVFQVKLCVNCAEVKLTNSEFELLMPIILMFAVQCEEKVLHARTEQFLCGRLPLKETQLLLFPGPADLTQASFGEVYELSPEQCAMLNDEKFGCQLADE